MLFKIAFRRKSALISSNHTKGSRFSHKIIDKLVKSLRGIFALFKMRQSIPLKLIFENCNYFFRSYRLRVKRLIEFLKDDNDVNVSTFQETFRGQTNSIKKQVDTEFNRLLAAL
jgi:hypothetical protein